MAKRSSNITEDREKKIIEHIKSIRDKISWKIVIQLLQKEFGELYVEQGLRNHKKIVDAYRTQRTILTKNRLASNAKQKQACNVELLIELQLKNEQLKKENEAYAAKFVVWAHNAYSKNGLTELELNEPIIKSAVC